MFWLNRSRTSTLGIIAATPKARTRTRTAARKPLYHQRVANGTVRNCLGRIGNSCGLLRLPSATGGTNRADQGALKFKPEPIQWYSNDDDQNGANDDYPFDFREHLTELIGLRDGHAGIPLNPWDLFKSFCFIPRQLVL